MLSFRGELACGFRWEWSGTSWISRGATFLQAIARTKPGVSRERIAVQVNALFSQTRRGPSGGIHALAAGSGDATGGILDRVGTAAPVDHAGRVAPLVAGLHHQREQPAAVADSVAPVTKSLLAWRWERGAARSSRSLDSEGALVAIVAAAAGLGVAQIRDSISGPLGAGGHSAIAGGGVGC